MFRGAFDEVIREIAHRAFREEYEEQGHISALRGFRATLERNNLTFHIGLESGYATTAYLGSRLCSRDYPIWSELVLDTRGVDGQLGGRPRRQYPPGQLNHRVHMIFATIREDVVLWAECEEHHRRYTEAMARCLDPGLKEQLRLQRDMAITRAQMHHSRRQPHNTARARDLRDWSWVRRVAEPVSIARGEISDALSTLRTERVDLREINNPDYLQRMGFREEELVRMRAEVARRMAQEMERYFSGIFPSNPVSPEDAERLRLVEERRLANRREEEARREAARARGLTLLKENLTQKQLKDYERHGYFHVRGGETGTFYRILQGRQINIRIMEKGPRSRIVAKLCFLPAGDLVEGDVMLAQKHALELQEGKALKIANRYPPDREFSENTYASRAVSLTFPNRIYGNQPGWDV